MKCAALIIGINRYQDPGIQSLHCAEKDALNLELLLGRDCGFEVRCLINEQASRRAIVHSLRELRRGLGPGDALLVYFAGHGHDLPDGQHVLLPADVSLEDLDDGIHADVLAVRGLESITRHCGASRFHLYDACRTPLRVGAHDSHVRLSEVVARNLVGFVEQEDARTRSPLVAMSACSPEERAFELRRLGRSVFSLAFEGLVREHLDSRLEMVWPGDVLQRISARTKELLGQHGLSGAQNPLLAVNRDRVVLLEGVATPAPTAPVRDQTPVVSEVTVKCPACRKRNRPENTFECNVCGRDYLCLEHRDSQELSCNWCAEEQRAEGRRQDAARHTRWPQSDKPWENSLGLKFVPVPGTEVHFCIWPTRVSDFAAFATANGREGRGGFDWDGKVWVKNPNRSWKEPGFDQGPTHPVCLVSFEDATAFCRWLTEKEHAEGILGPAQAYRLPRDLEWSTAVGLVSEMGRTPQERSGRIANVYPWGGQWPPPKGAGNFADQALKAKYPGSALIEGYEDGWPETSPVGLFARNRYGLHDMAGNVWEWCADFYNGQEGSRVLRGGSWFSLGPGLLLSSYRITGNPSNRSSHIGFRLVIDQGASAPR